MRLLNFFLSTSLFLGILFYPPSALRAQDTKSSANERGGTAPRGSADKYHAHAQQDGVSVGAELLTPKEVSKKFSADLNRCCLVVEIAVYPKKDELLDVYRDNFTLIIEGSDRAFRPENAAVVAAKLEKGTGSNGGVTTTTEAGVGYESGTYTDPITGQPVHAHGVTTSVGVGVGVGNGDPASDHDREVVERELSEKGLPEAKVSVPVSGYLYFSLPKQKKDTKYRLEYMVKGEAITLQLP